MKNETLKLIQSARRHTVLSPGSRTLQRLAAEPTPIATRALMAHADRLAARMRLTAEQPNLLAICERFVQAVQPEVRLHVEITVNDRRLS
ncbi:hypothetical protein [Methylocaldum sp.]|jgi:hypothetical protein|uniref:hypothetical protein n=1 Tax=Methylocaldum sp. TaxID=1969727 RepID=UPI00322012F6